MKKSMRNIGKRFLGLILMLGLVIELPGVYGLAEEVEKKEALAVDRKNPLNPVHHCAKDTTDWSYIYFGSYPQAEVVGDELTSAIIGAVYDTNGDAVVDGIKYRRISKSDVNNENNFGDSIYRYFRWERIKWRILKNDGTTLFVMADQGLDCKCYNDEQVSVTWETCTLRNWLNDDFYGAAFDSKEREAIITQTVVNNKNNNPEYDTDGGNDTTDNIYLLSSEEIMNPGYGFCWDSQKNHRIKASDYACAKGTFTYMDNCTWWLRSPGSSAQDALEVWWDGTIVWGGSYVNNDEACVPALHIDLSSSCYLPAGGMDGLSNPVHHCEDDDVTDWSYVYFGSYPQTEVVGNELTDAIIGAAYDANGDATIDGVKYRRISENDTKFAYYWGDSDYRYFKWEKIKWRVLKNDGNTLFIVADNGLDCWEADGADYFVLRNWLNNVFLLTAFNNGEKETIIPCTTIHMDNITDEIENKIDRTTLVDLLSYEEVTNPEYGFCEDNSIYSVSRRVRYSDYAHARGSGNHWFLQEKSKGYLEYEFVDARGRVYVYHEDDITHTGIVYASVVPVLHINLSSPFWSLADDGTSGDGSSLGNKVDEPNQSKVSEFYKVSEYTYKITNSTEVSFTGVENKKKTTVTIPKTVTIAGKSYKVTKIEDNAFQKSQVKKVKIGENVKTIGMKAFYNCKKLTNVTIPSKVNKIGKQAFSGCKNLKKMEIKTVKLTMKNVGTGAFKGISAKVKIKVPKKKKAVYKKLLQARGVSKKIKF